MRRGIVVILCLMLLALPAMAMSISPMAIEMLAVGKGARGQVVVTNTSNKPLPVEITYERLSYDESGKQRTSKAGDDLLVLPPTALIRPGSSQTFRLQWVGNPDLKESQSFMVYARQLPVRLPASEKRARVQVVSAFGIIVNVAPARGQADLKLLSWQPAKDAKGRPAVAVLVENPTDVHALMNRSHLRLGSLSLGPDALQQRIGFGVVGPHKRRRFLVSLVGISDRPSGKGSIAYLGRDR